MNPGAENLTIQLIKQTPDQPLGFRLQGGADFTTPLSIQSVNPGSCADVCGLRAGDAVLSINGRPSDEMEHDEAKRIIQLSGGNITMLIKRGAVTVWKPSVTPLSQLRPNEPVISPASHSPTAPSSDQQFIQRTSLAANKQEFKPIGTGYNRSAKPFSGFGGSSSNTPVPSQVNSQFSNYSSPVAPSQEPVSPYAPPGPSVQSQQVYGAQDYSQQQSTRHNYSGESDGYMPNVASLKLEEQCVVSSISPHKPPTVSVTGHREMETSHVNNQSSGRVSPMIITPTMLAIQQSENKQKAIRPLSPSYAALSALIDSDSTANNSKTIYSRLTVDGSRGDTLRSISPTLMLIQQEEGLHMSQHSGTGQAAVTSARMIDPKDGEEIRYHGFVDHNKQSRSFKMLQEEVLDSNGTPAQEPSGSLPSGIRSVRAPVTKPPSEKPQGQYMTCKECGTLIVGVFVKISGVPMHPECFKCVHCGKNLKNQGYFRVSEKLYCDVHARQAAEQQAGGDLSAVPVYR